MRNLEEDLSLSLRQEGMFKWSIAFKIIGWTFLNDIMTGRRRDPQRWHLWNGRANMDSCIERVSKRCVI